MSERCPYSSLMFGQCRLDRHDLSINHCYNGMHGHAVYWNEDDSIFFERMLKRGDVDAAEEWAPEGCCRTCQRPFRTILNFWRKNTIKQFCWGYWCVNCVWKSHKVKLSEISFV